MSTRIPGRHAIATPLQLTESRRRHRAHNDESEADAVATRARLVAIEKNVRPSQAPAAVGNTSPAYASRRHPHQHCAFLRRLAAGQKRSGSSIDLIRDQEALMRGTERSLITCPVPATRLIPVGPGQGDAEHRRPTARSCS